MGETTRGGAAAGSAGDPNAARGPKVFRGVDVLRTTSWKRILASIAAFTALMGAVSGFAGPAAGALVRVVMLLSFFAAAFFGARRLGKPRIQGVDVTFDDTGVYAGGQRLADRSEIEEGSVQPRLAGTVVRLGRGGWRAAVDLRMKDLADGRALVTSLGLDPSHRAMSFRAVSQIAVRKRFLPWIAAAAVLVILLAAHVVPPVGAAAFVPLYVSFIGAMMMPTWVDVGADGVLVRWLGRRQFIPIATIKDVVQLPGIVRLTHHDGTSTDLVLAMGSHKKNPLQVAYAATLTERLMEAMSAARSGVEGAAEALVLERRDRPVDAWIRELRSSLVHDPRFREAPVLPERLWRLVEDPSVAASQRAAAAVALAPSLDESGRKRLRVAGAASVAPKLRVALDAAVGDDDAALAEALGELEDESGPSEPKRSAV